MKLLIVDDEELTRVGVISSINWQSIGIDEVLQACLLYTSPSPRDS